MKIIAALLIFSVFAAIVMAPETSLSIRLVCGGLAAAILTFVLVRSDVKRP